jgi:hypothetical protein
MRISIYAINLIYTQVYTKMYYRNNRILKCGVCRDKPWPCHKIACEINCATKKETNEL